MSTHHSERQAEVTEASVHAAIRDRVQRLMYDVRTARRELEAFFTSGYVSSESLHNLTADLLDLTLDTICKADSLERKLGKGLNK